MTDKEEIIIDGVDVSKCRYFLKDTEGQDYNTDEFVKGCCEAKGCYIGCEFIGYSICRGDKDCYYKQLKHKEQECEELKEKYEEIKEDRYNLNMEMYTLDRYRKALEEIEEYVQSQLDGFGNDVYLMHKVAINKILNIINKAKDSE